MAITPNGLGQVELTGDRKALMLKVFSGEVLTAFERNNIMMPLHTVRTIENGKSSQFPIMGVFSEDDVQDFAPGDTIATGSIKHNERTIVIEGLKVASTFVDQYEEKMNHYETRSYYANQLGLSLARKIDKRILTEVYNASQATGVASQPDGFTVTNTAIASAADISAKGDALLESIYKAVATMNATDVVGEKYFVTTPDNYNALVLSQKGINSDFTAGANGGVDTGKILQLAGVTILWSNNLPSVAASEGYVFTKDAVGTVKFMDVSAESEYLIERQGTVLVAKYATGHGILNPGCAGIIKSA